MFPSVLMSAPNGLSESQMNAVTQALWALIIARGVSGVYSLQVCSGLMWDGISVKTYGQVIKPSQQKNLCLIKCTSHSKTVEKPRCSRSIKNFTSQRVFRKTWNTAQGSQSVVRSRPGDTCVQVCTGDNRQTGSGRKKKSTAHVDNFRKFQVAAKDEI